MRTRWVLPRLHVVTDQRIIDDERFTDLAGELIEAGGDRLALHLRGPGISGRRLYDLAAGLTRLASRSGARIIVNDRVDVALAAGAAGVQVGSCGLPIEQVRRLLGGGRLLGASVHDPAEARAALAGGADFLLAGTLFPSRSHPGRSGSGVRWLEEIAPAATPVVGIGGITLERVAQVRAAGAAGVAVITAVWDAPDPRDALLRFMDALYQ